MSNRADKVRGKSTDPFQIRHLVTEALASPPGTSRADDIYSHVFDCNPEDSLCDSEDFSSTDRKKRLFARQWGVYAEALTAEYLMKKGMPIREWNWRPIHGKGEADLITQSGNRIIFVEVKARTNPEDDPWKAITAKKRSDLCRGADIYLKSLLGNMEYQFDVALFTGTPEEHTFEYIADAFLAPLRTKP